MDVREHILFISYDGMTDPLGQSQVLPYLKGLSAMGYNISLISCEKVERYSKFRQTIEDICQTANINWYPLDYTKTPPLLSTIKDIRSINKKVDEIHRNHPIDLIHCRSYIAAMSALRMKKKVNMKVLFDMRGFWADERIDGNIWSLSNPVFKLVYTFFKKKEKEFFTKFDHIISLTTNGKSEILSWNLPNVTESKITVIPCCVDLNLFDPQKIDQHQITTKMAELNLSEEDYVLGYVGSIGTWYMLPEMLDYFKVLVNENPNAKFLFVTSEDPQMVLTLAEQKGIATSSIRVTSCLHKDVPLHIALFNASIFFIKPAYSKKASSPTKQGEIMAMGVPLICNAGVGDTDKIVYDYESGSVIQHLDGANYWVSIQKGVTFNKERTMVGAKEYFSLEEGVRRYANAYKLLLS